MSFEVLIKFLQRILLFVILVILLFLLVCFVLFFLFYFSLSVVWVPPQLAFGHNQGDSLSHLMLITVPVKFQLKGCQEPCNEVGSLSPAKQWGCIYNFKVWETLTQLYQNARNILRHKWNINYSKILLQNLLSKSYWWKNTLHLYKVLCYKRNFYQEVPLKFENEVCSYFPYFFWYFSVNVYTY